MREYGYYIEEAPVGQFPELERQYCRFSTGGYAGAGSPDRADAAAQALGKRRRIRAVA